MHTFTTRQTRGKGFFFSNERTRRKSSEGEFSCERNNHLGNVLAVISDKVNLYGSGRKVNDKVVADSVRATVVSASDYYLFGLTMPGRQFSSSTYRYGFNGQEKVDEILGNGSHNTAEFWEYDTRLGRRWNLDPKPRIGLSDYSAFGDNPIFNKDPDGAYFFGLFGSTSEQRRTARDFAAATGGEIKNIISKNISVEYTTVSMEKDNESSVGFSPVAEGKTMHFQRSGGLDFGDWATNFHMRGIYEGNLKMGEYDIYTGYPKGSGALASPTIDPIDLFAGILTGGLLSSGAKTVAAEGVANSELAGFSKTIIKNMNNPDRYVPAAFLDDVAKNTKGFADPKGNSQALMHYSPLIKNGKAYNLEVLFNKSENMILHFKYTTKAIGNLPATNK